MASLVLGAAGAVVGSFFGPLGASIGWTLGAALGNALDPQKQQGPRLTDLHLQSSTYGTMIPVLYGTMREAGTVIWQTDLVPHPQTEGGKGGPEVTTYTYSASFAIGLCEGPIDGVRRVWADGRLVYDLSEGNATNAFPFTLYLGTETQEPDPTIEADKGAGNVPAHRGLAYVVFDSVMLSDYGNRIPQLTFEIQQVARTNGQIRSTAKNSAEPVHYRANGAGDWAAIIDWPARDDPIRVHNLTSAEIDEFDQTLAFSDSVASGTADFRPVEVDLTGTVAPFTFYRYYAVGMVVIDGAPTPLYADPTVTIGSTTAQPALALHGVWIVGNQPYGTENYGHTAGIAAGEYLGGAVLSADGAKLFVLTAPAATVSGSAVINKWYCVEDGAIVDQGTVSPALSIYDLGFGDLAEFHFAASSAENNGRYLWRYYGAMATNGGGVEVFEIDPTTKVLARNAACGTLNVGTDPYDFIHGSCRAFKEGYLGIAGGSTLAIFTRFPVSDSVAVPLSDIVTDISERAGFAPSDIEVSALTDLVDGFKLDSQGAARAALEPLQQAYFFDAVDSDVVKFVKRGGISLVSVADTDLAAASGGELPAALSTVRSAEAELPRIINLTYVAKDSDYQQSTQIAQRQTTSSELAITLSLPIAMSDETARRIVEAMLYTAWLEREKFKVSLPRRYAYIEPTDVITVGTRVLRLTNQEAHADNTHIFDAVLGNATVVNQPAPGISGAGGFTGQAVSSGLTERGPTTLQLLDIPLAADADTPGFYAAMTGQDPWPGASLFQSIDDGTSYASILTRTTVDVIGVASTALGDFSGGNIVDELNSVTVVLERGSLSSTTLVGLLNGANFALLGNEILKYRDATLVGTNTYTLTGLQRGRRGTEWAQAGHAIGDRFVALPVASLASTYVGNPLRYKAVTSGRTLASAAANTFTITGEAWRCYAPCGLGGGVDASGNVTLNWIRRTRLGGAWLNGADAALGEASESYVVQIWNSTFSQCARQITATSPTCSYTAAQQIADFGATQQTIYFTVGQVGTYGLGRQASGSAPGAGGSSGNPLAAITPYGSSTVGLPALATTRTTVLGTSSSRVTLDGWDPATEWVISFTTGSAKTNPGKLVIAEYYGSPTQRTGVLATAPDGAALGPGCELAGTTLTFNYYVGSVNPYPSFYPLLAPSTTYYLTLRTSAISGAYCDFLPPSI